MGRKTTFIATSLGANKVKIVEPIRQLFPSFVIAIQQWPAGKVVSYQRLHS